MTLKNKAALQYMLPLLLTYVATVAAVSSGQRPEWIDLARAALPATGMLVLCHLMQDLLPKSIKEFLVFLRFRARLPGHRAFTQYCRDDPRVPETYIRETLNEIGGSARAQNAHWYLLYRDVSKEPLIEHENLRYLAWRDTTATLCLLTLATPMLPFFEFLLMHQAINISLACAGAAVLTSIAARNAAYSLVKNVVAFASGSTASPME